MRAGAKRKKDPGKQHPEASDSEEEEMVRVLEVQEEVVDYEDNLTYHEDSLSVIKGQVDTGLGKNLTVWVTTDTGSMTQLMHTSYANKMKFKVEKLPAAKWFHITSPGGGRDDITEQVTLKLRIKMKKESSSEETYTDNAALEEERVVHW